jgi:hypothetical protein
VHFSNHKNENSGAASFHPASLYILNIQYFLYSGRNHPVLGW